MIKIFQIDIHQDKNKVKFMPFDFIKNFDFSIYNEIWSGELDCENLENVFKVFNLEHPKDFTGHSLSVSDIVQVINSNTEINGYYYCDSFGWKQLDIE